MRAPKLKIKMVNKTMQSCCTLCDGQCVENEVVYKSYTTRSVTNYLRDNKVIIYETYRCMPLLGNESKVAPGWKEHIVCYTVAFVKKDKLKSTVNISNYS